MNSAPQSAPQMLIPRTDTRGHLNQFFSKDPNLVIFEEFQRIYGEDRAQRFLAYRHLYEATKRTRVLPPHPLHVNLAMIDACQMKCPHCYRQYNADKTPKRMLYWDEVRKVIDECAEIGVPSMFFGSGSELFLHKHGIEALEYASAKGILDIFAVTNGELLTEEITERLFAANVSRVNISLDAATAETFAKVRGNGYETILRNIEYLLRRKEELGRRLPILRISFVNYNLNSHEKDAFIAKWRDKADIVDVQTPMDIRYVNTQPFGDIDKMDCTYPWVMLLVGWDGEIKPCCLEFAKHLELTNIATRGIKDTWFGPELEALRTQFVENRDIPRTCINCIKSTDPATIFDPISV